MAVTDCSIDEPDLTEARADSLQGHTGPSAYRCETCGDAIPEERRQTEPGTEYCFDCTDALIRLFKRGFT